MKPLTGLLCLALLSLSSALGPKPLVPESCNTTEFQAGLLLDEINKDRVDGYVFSLFRVVDVHRQPEGAGDIFYFTIDVLETDCPIISGKSWKDCGDRPIHETVFGQCKGVIYINKPLRTVWLPRYNCTLSAGSSGFIDKLCPECPHMQHDLENHVNKAEKTVVKYNSDSNNTHYFKLDKMERASTQWTSKGRIHFPEFSIKETNCARLTANVSECEFLEDDKAHVGFCKGSVFNLHHDSHVEAKCEIYDLKHSGHPHHRQHDHHEHGRGHEHSHGHEHGHMHRTRKGHPHHENHHPNGHNHTHTEDGNHHNKMKDGHKHGHGSPNGEPQKHHESSSEENTGFKPDPKLLTKPIGSIQHILLHFLFDVIPSPSIPDPLPSVVPSGAPSVSGPLVPLQDPEPQPFPRSPSNSKDCPGEHKKSIKYIHSFLPVPY